MNNHVAIFSRLAGYAVNKALSAENRVKSVDGIQYLINNMNIINHSLMALAVKMINKAKQRHDVDTEELATNLKDIIYISVVSYAKRAY